MTDKPRSNKGRLIIAVILILAAAAFALHQFRMSRPPRPSGPGGSGSANSLTGNQPPRAPSRKEQDKKRQELIVELNLSAEQVEKLREISEKHGHVEDVRELGAILREMGQDLSPEQRQMAQAYIHRQVKQELRRQHPNMSSEEIEKLFRKALNDLKSNQPPGSIPDDNTPHPDARQRR